LSLPPFLPTPPFFTTTADAPAPAPAPAFVPLIASSTSSFFLRILSIFSRLRAWDHAPPAPVEEEEGEKVRRERVMCFFTSSEEEEEGEEEEEVLELWRR